MTWSESTRWQRAGPWPWLAGISLLGASIAAVVHVRNLHKADTVARAMTGGDPDHAAGPLRRYGCGGCHTIAGLPGADGQVGPPLVDMRRRVYVAGALRNTPDDIVRFIVSPPSVWPGSAMPITGISEAEARDVAAFLYAQ